jgi:hypothetical protein
LPWGVHPIVCGSQKRQCLHGKIYEISRSFYSRRLGALEVPNRIVMTLPMRMRVKSNWFKDDENSNRNKFTRNDESIGIAANKVDGVRACLIDKNFSAHQGVEDDDLNMICFGGLLVGHALAWELVQTFLAARFKGAERFRRRLAKVAELENAPLKMTS